MHITSGSFWEQSEGFQNAGAAIFFLSLFVRGTKGYKYSILSLKLLRFKNFAATVQQVSRYRFDVFFLRCVFHAVTSCAYVF